MCIADICILPGTLHCRPWHRPPVHSLPFFSYRTSPDPVLPPPSVYCPPPLRAALQPAATRCALLTTWSGAAMTCSWASTPSHPSPLPTTACASEWAVQCGTAGCRAACGSGSVQVWGQDSLVHTAGTAACCSEWLPGGRWLKGDSAAVQQGGSHSWATKCRWLSSVVCPAGGPRCLGARSTCRSATSATGSS